MQSFEKLNARSVAVVVDPIQSVKGKVVIDCFRLINPQTMMMGQEPRQHTSNVGYLNKPSIQVNATLPSSQRGTLLSSLCSYLCNPNLVVFDSVLFQALIHGLNRHYYSMVLDYRKNALEEKMLMNIYQKSWTEGLKTVRYEDHSASNEKTVEVMPTRATFLLYRLPRKHPLGE